MFLRLLYQSFRRQQRRKLLAGIAVVLGVAVATAMMAVGVSVGDKINRELRSYGANIVVYPEDAALDVRIGDQQVKPASRGAYLPESSLPKIKGIFWGHNILAFAPFLYTQAEIDGQTVPAVGTYFAKKLHFGKEEFTEGVEKLYPWWKLEGSWPLDEPQSVLSRSPNEQICKSVKSVRSKNCHPEVRAADEGSPEMRRTSLSQTRLLNQDRWSRSRHLQYSTGILHEILPPPAQLRYAELSARRQDDRFVARRQDDRFIRVASLNQPSRDSSAAGARLRISPARERWVRESDKFPQPASAGGTGFRPPRRALDRGISPTQRSRAGLILGFAPVALRAPYADFRSQVLIGARLAQRLNKKVGDAIGLSGHTVQISGILSTGGNEDNEIIAPLSLAQALAHAPDAVDKIYVSALTKPEDAFARRDPEKLSPADHDRWYCSPYANSIAFQLREVFPHARAEQIRQAAQNEGAVLSHISGLMLLISLAALAAAALAVSAAMATTILERRHEVGLMKSLGATAGAIAALFVTEASLLAVAAGLIGFGLGDILARRIGSAVFNAPISVTPVLLPIVLFLALVVTIGGSAVAIRRALKLNPVLVLRGDVLRGDA